MFMQKLIIEQKSTYVSDKVAALCPIFLCRVTYVPAVYSSTLTQNIEDVSVTLVGGMFCDLC